MVGVSCSLLRVLVFDVDVNWLLCWVAVRCCLLSVVVCCCGFLDCLLAVVALIVLVGICLIYFMFVDVGLLLLNAFDVVLCIVV